jgi:transposase-like protein
MTKTLRTSPADARRYHRSDRVALLKALTTSKKTMKDFAEDHGISPSTVTGWVNRYCDSITANTIRTRGHKARGAAVSKAILARKKQVVASPKKATPTQIIIFQAIKTLDELKAKFEKLL